MCSHQEYSVITSQTRHKRAKGIPEGGQRNDQRKGGTCHMRKESKDCVSSTLKDKNTDSILLKFVRSSRGCGHAHHIVICQNQQGCLQAWKKLILRQRKGNSTADLR